MSKTKRRHNRVSGGTAEKVDRIVKSLRTHHIPELELHHNPSGNLIFAIYMKRQGKSR